MDSKYFLFGCSVNSFALNKKNELYLHNYLELSIISLIIVVFFCVSRSAVNEFRHSGHKTV